MEVAMVARRTPDETREALLDAAFWEIFRHGFQAARLDAILEKAGVTKGALYHHFASKRELGYAVVDEVLHGWVRVHWVEPLARAADPVEGIKGAIQAVEASAPPELWELGCPLNNLAQEMSPLDEGFRTRISSLYRVWQGGITRALERGQKNGTVRDDVDGAQVAAFIVASVEGSSGLAKNAQDPDLFRTAIRGLEMYLDGLQARAVAV